MSRNVKYWRSPWMALRWAGAAMQEAAKGFRRLKAYKQLPLLQAALAVRKARATSSNARVPKPRRLRRFSISDARFALFNIKRDIAPAACVKRLAKHTIAFTRSDVPMFLSLGESNMMLSWRGNTAGARIVGSDFGKLLILLLLSNSGIATGASPETALDE